MRILLSIAVGMVHAMQDGVRARMQEARPLSHVCQEVKETLPSTAHLEHAMSTVSVQKKCLAKHAQRPMPNEECDDNGHVEGSTSGSGLGGASAFRHLSAARPQPGEFHGEFA